MKKLIQFLKEVRAEFKNISWPKRDALIQLTFVVISVSIVISLILGGFDYLFTNSISLLGSQATTKNIPAPELISPSPIASPTATTSITPTKAVKK